MPSEKNTITPESQPGDWEKLDHLIRDIGIGLLTTVDPKGHFHTRPLQTLQVEDRQTLWFFTDWSSPKVHEMHDDVRVALAYASPARHSYVAVSGTSHPPARSGKGPGALDWWSSAPTIRRARKIRASPCCAFASSAQNIGSPPGAAPISLPPRKRHYRNSGRRDRREPQTRIASRIALKRLPIHSRPRAPRLFLRRQRNSKA